MEKCTLCPRNCFVNRKLGEKGICGQTSTLKVARAALHFWEEPCISGEKGSGAVFFSGCALHCVFCQNQEIANGSVGKEISNERLSEIFLELQEKGANNINLVTPGHFVPQIVPAIERARNQGLNLPIVYNTSSYENVDSIRELEGIVDIYLPDFKYMSSSLSKKYSHAPDYGEVAKKVVAEMVRQTGAASFYEKEGQELMQRGVIVRHLILPGCMEDSKDIIRYLYETYGDTIYLSIMNQFTPLKNVEKYPELNRKLTGDEYDEVVDFAIDLGVENGFIQEGETAEESFIPDFNCEGV
ncbi:MAG: 4Fe-4S cluster-binding domain-containing protein [Roseburia sp.]|uniref:radical SAM protein n=1 Tax=Roseburia sp. 831b TaxID=1261635 RepID=UPI000950D654|nr:4Fe-4S cluster-binding domain-containing protein [Roseburia sp. 831b]MCI5918111.1 4Fe-4S cluster-binding domain-containing protein [Roseburia sp.]MDY5884096.1 4Fe-4S cluster-binding domain-containing protein [Roseburia sp.]WVK71834.1 4Fe-4S cluster-binding domain-containing protein [Roseburia sp. 831b]